MIDNIYLGHLLSEILDHIDGYKLAFFTTSNLIIAYISSKTTLWLTDRKQHREAKTRFKNRLICLAHELPINFKFVGNSRNPFQTLALEKLVYDEPLVHDDPVLFELAHNCLNTALILSTSEQSTLAPKDGQFLMRQLAEYLSSVYGIKIQDQEVGARQPAPIQLESKKRLLHLLMRITNPSRK